MLIKAHALCRPGGLIIFVYNHRTPCRAASVDEDPSGRPLRKDQRPLRAGPCWSSCSHLTRLDHLPDDLGPTAGVPGQGRDVRRAGQSTGAPYCNHRIISGRLQKYASAIYAKLAILSVSMRL